MHGLIGALPEGMAGAIPERWRQWLIRSGIIVGLGLAFVFLQLQ